MTGAECNLGLDVTAEDGSNISIRDSGLQGVGSVNGTSVTASIDGLGVVNKIRVTNSVLTS